MLEPAAKEAQIQVGVVGFLSLLTLFLNFLIYFLQ